MTPPQKNTHRNRFSEPVASRRWQIAMGIILLAATLSCVVMLCCEHGLRGIFTENSGNLETEPLQRPYGDASPGDQKSAILSFVLGFVVPHAALLTAFFLGRRRYEGSFEYFKTDQMPAWQVCVAMVLVTLASIFLVWRVVNTIVFSDYLEVKFIEGLNYQQLACDKTLPAQISDTCMYAGLILFMGEMFGLLSGKGASDNGASDDSRPPQRAEGSGELHSKLGLSSRVYLALDQAGIRTVAELVTYSALQLRALPNIGEKAVREIQTKLAEQGLELAPD